MTYVVLVTEVIFGFLGGALLMRVWDVTHTLKVMARRHSEDLLREIRQHADASYKEGWQHCRDYVIRRGLDGANAASAQGHEGNP